MRKWIAMLCVFAVLSILSACGLAIGIWATVSMARVYPRPLDSFWSFDLSITLMSVSLVVLVVTVLGIVFSIQKLRKKGDGNEND